MKALVLLDACSEPNLLPLLTSASVEAKGHAIRALASCGTIRAVEPLLAVEGDDALREFARSTVRAIQGRMPGADAGGLSVVAGVEGGAVSIVPAPEREKV